MQRFLGIMAFLCFASHTFAIEVNDINYPSVRVGVENAAIQNPSGDFHRRRVYSLHYRQPVYLNFFAKFDLQMVPDPKQQSERLDVRNDMTNLLVLAGVSYPILFRLNFALGPSFIRSSSTYDFDGESSNFTSTSTGFAYKFFADYAVNRDFEVSVIFQIHNRTTDQKIDRYYGITFGYNLPIGYTTTSKTW